MLSIRIPSTFEISSECSDRSRPSKGSDGHYNFQVTDEEYMFWNGLTSVERDELTLLIRRNCFFDVLHSAMKKERPGNYSVENEKFVELRS